MRNKIAVLLIVLFGIITLTACDNSEEHVHNFVNYVSNGDATCVSPGTETAKCEGCELTDTRDEDSVGDHFFLSYSSNNDATCSSNGTETAKCLYCSETDTREVADSALPHSFTNYVSDENATCSANGTETAKCDNCDATDTKEVANSQLSHSFTNYVSDENATLEADGTETAKCDHCDATDTRTDEDSHQVVTDHMLDSNSKYSGVLLYNVPQGEATFTYVDSGCVYTGDFVDGLFHGEGVFTWTTGWSFEGTFANGVATYGKTISPATEGLIWYEGAMKALLDIDSTQLGTGYYAYSDGCNYTGQMYGQGALAGCTFSGEGTFSWPNGDKIIARFENGAPVEGKKVFPNECVYEGEFVNWNYNGKGTFSWPSGDLLVGTFANGAPVTGKYTYANTMCYEGQFNSAWQFHGQGTFNWTTYNEDGSVKAWSNRYEGEFVNGNAAGLTGTMTYAIALNGSNAAGLHSFTGVMELLGLAKVDQTGTGKIVFDDGSYYIGDVYLNAEHVASVTGNGVYYNADGSVKE